MSEHEDQRDKLGREYSDWELFKRLMAYTRPHWLIFSLALIAMFISTLLSMIQPIILKIAIDDFITPRDTDGLGLVAITYFVISIFSFLLSVVATYVTFITGLKIITQIRQETFYKLQELGMDYYDREASGR
ncbi:MAG: ABC transporter transmembrane domain-containing protein, partial [Candidatus Hodarchaeales archaeon]